MEEAIFIMLAAFTGILLAYVIALIKKD